MAVYDLYCRLSIAPDGTRETVERQERDMRADLARTGDEVGEVFVDNGKSAWNPKVVRKDFERLLEKIQGGTTRHVMVWHMDRYIRQPYDLERLVRLAEERVIIRSLMGELDLRNSDQLLTARMLCNVACKASDDTSRRVKAKLEDRVSKGKPVGRSRSFGYRSDGSIVEEEAKILQEAARRFLAGEGWAVIVADFAKRGVRTLTGTPFTRTSLRETLARPIVGGVITHHGKPAGQLAEAILDPETFADLSAVLASGRRGRPISGRYLLTGYVFCGTCGAQKRGCTLRSKSQLLAGGEPRRVYRCAPEGNRKCAQSVTAEYVEAIVAEHVKAALANPNYRSRLRGVRSAAEDQVAELTKTAKRLGTALAHLSENYDLIPEAEYQASRIRLMTKLADIQGLLREANDPTMAEAALAAEVTEHWETASEEVRRQLIGGVVRRVTVAPADAFPRIPGQQGSVFDPRRVSVELLLPTVSAVRSLGVVAR